MSFRGLFDRFLGEEGVSPVIGEILMVAIVVLMAAVVSAFVFGVVTIPSPTPQASLSVDEVVLDNDGVEVVLVHESGDALSAEDTEIIVTSLDDSDESNTTGLSEWGVDDEWVVGERISNTVDLEDDPDEVEIRVVDEVSGGTVGVLVGSVVDS